MRDEKNWEERVLPSIIKKSFSPRLQRDLNLFTPPKITQVESSFIYGKTGSGKTIRAAFMFLAERKKQYLEGSTEEEKTYIFINVCDLFARLKACFDDRSSFESELNQLLNAHLLVLDDLGVERVSDWTWGVLYQIINYRYEQLKITIVTSNFSLEELALKMEDDRLPSRLARMCRVIRLEGSFTHD